MGNRRFPPKRKEDPHKEDGQASPIQKICHRSHYRNRHRHSLPAIDCQPRPHLVRLEMAGSAHSPVLACPLVNPA